MKLKLLSIVLFTAFLASTASSQRQNLSIDSDQVQRIQQLNLTDLEKKFNQNTEKIPGFVGSLIGDQTLAVNLSGVETGSKFFEEDVIGIKTEGKKISGIKWGSYNKTTLKIWIDQNDIEKISGSSKPIQKFKKMLKSGEIRYETYSFTTKIKMAVLSFFL